MRAVASYGSDAGGSTAYEERLTARVRELLSMAPYDLNTTSVFVLAQVANGSRSIADLGWTREQARQVRQSMLSFAEDWDAPGMDVYDEL